MEAFPARLGRFEEGLTGQGSIEIVARQRLPVRVQRGELINPLQGQVQIAISAGLAIEEAQDVDRGHVHLGAAGIDQSRVLFAHKLPGQ